MKKILDMGRKDYYNKTIRRNENQMEAGRPACMTVVSGGNRRYHEIRTDHQQFAGTGHV
ncbi:MAG: hypothetical protein PUE22_06965 [Roseburia porci]|uniref:hypothetical protein n=1 Tax=Roseburia porci TaxID=2605790 RepID=UPI0018A6D2F3|nr:hypothetical protein [Roseburia porci]MCI5517332.1 hypothetical protein [Roseburia sp.]MDD6743225.1 hypothetical protein [Roseburia porci]